MGSRQVWDGEGMPKIGEGMPKIGDRVLIHLAGEDSLSEHEVTGFTVDRTAHYGQWRIKVHLAAEGPFSKIARLLDDVWPLTHREVL